MITEHEPEPADANAAEALGDLDYHRGLADYDEDLGRLMDPVWEDHYRHPVDPEFEGLSPMPQVFESPGRVESGQAH
jgi:hypothetical protein